MNTAIDELMTPNLQPVKGRGRSGLGVLRLDDVCSLE